ncbi:hypothetical protein FPRO04_13205 [Fusarium proliferatum]|nr:hypothetical protein FPRO04_13205 [Fusarium proliferatum]
MSREDLVIHYNDSINSDNLAAASALLKATQGKRNIARCKELINQHFPSVENPFKTLIGGETKQQDIDDIKDLAEDDRKILEMAVKAKYGSIDDGTLHGQLGALDLATCLSEGSKAEPIEVLVDYETLQHIANPVNLHMHHHEELFNRTEADLNDYHAIQKKVLHLGRRTDELRD